MKKLVLITNLVFLSSGFSYAESSEPDFALTQFYLETSAKYAMEYASAAKSEDINRIMRLSCLQLEIPMESLDPEAWPPERKTDIASLKEKASTLYQQLKAQGYCE